MSQLATANCGSQVDFVTGAVSVVIGVAKSVASQFNAIEMGKGTTIRERLAGNMTVPTCSAARF